MAMTVSCLLSKILEERELHGTRRGTVGGRERVVEPGPEIPMAEEVEAKKGDEIGEGPSPAGLELQVLQDQDGDERRPELDLKSVGAGADEGLDSEILFDGFEEALDLPAVTVERGDRRSAELEVIREEHESPIVVLVEDLDSPIEEGVRPLLVRDELDDLIAEDPPIRRNRAVFEDLVSGVGFQSGNEEGTSVGELLEPSEVQVAAIEDDDRPWRNRHPTSDSDVVFLAVGHDAEVRKVAVVVEEQMELDGSLRSPKLGPIEDRDAQVDDRRVEREKAPVESESVLRRVHPAAIAETDEQVPVEGPGPVLIGVRERRAGGSRDPEVAQLAFGRGQAVADLAKRLRPPEMAEEHRDELLPAGEPSGVTFGAMHARNLFEFQPRKELEKLAEDGRE